MLHAGWVCTTREPRKNPSTPWEKGSRYNYTKNCCGRIGQCCCRGTKKTQKTTEVVGREVWEKNLHTLQLVSPHPWVGGDGRTKQNFCGKRGGEFIHWVWTLQQGEPIGEVEKLSFQESQKKTVACFGSSFTLERDRCQQRRPKKKVMRGSQGGGEKKGGAQVKWIGGKGYVVSGQKLSGKGCWPEGISSTVEKERRRGVFGKGEEKRKRTSCLTHTRKKSDVHQVKKSRDITLRTPILGGKKNWMRKWERE